MSNIATALKSEIARVARKELKDEIAALRKLTSTHRSEIAALKRELKALGSALKRVRTSPAAATQRSAPASEAPPPQRGGRKPAFSAERLAAHRAKLGLSQAQMAQVIGASALSVYKWESGKVQPRAAQQAQIAAALKLGKRAAVAQLNAMQA